MGIYNPTDTFTNTTFLGVNDSQKCFVCDCEPNAVWVAKRTVFVCKECAVTKVAALIADACFTHDTEEFEKNIETVVKSMRYALMHAVVNKADTIHSAQDFQD